jgi:hypothetical protein
MIEFNDGSILGRQATPGFWKYVDIDWGSDGNPMRYVLAQDITEWLREYNISYVYKQRFGRGQHSGIHGDSMFHGIDIEFSDPAHEMLFKLTWM